ncbi:MAG TPA: diacylglycerol kinase family protein [Candidatus Methylomirabilis sp.]|jgi:diacylglycerol kinase (ATP)
MSVEAEEIQAVRRVGLVVNPRAGRGRGLRVAERLLPELAARGVTVARRVTARPGDATVFAAAALAEGMDAVVACGGDGTVNEVVQALAGTPGRLAVAAGGRGNDLARTLAVPRDPAAWARMVAAGHTRRLDVGAAGDRRFASVATLGFDAAVSARAARGLWVLQGKAAYVVATVLALRRFRPPVVEIRGAGRSYRGPILLVATANIGTYGGGMQIAPGALADDGLFRVCLIRDMPRYAVLGLLARVLSGGHVRHPAVELWDTPFLEVRAAPPCVLYADGEPIGETPIRLEILPRALRVIAPPEGEADPVRSS